MRLHRLELAAIGPFATVQRVDFDELSAGGLFLLDGPTGAGKSTVLDAITFALYGPGRHGGDGRLHSDFAESATEPFVTLEFSLRGVRHRVTRTPEFERPKKRGDGVTVQHASAHLQRWESGRWVSRSSNKAEIGDLLDEAIGLTREQFNQVVLLPQGEFATFLRANDDERRDVLSRLFGTELFQRVTDELEFRRQSAVRELAMAEDRVRSSVAAAGEAAGLDTARREELCAVLSPEREARLAELRGDLMDQVGSRQLEAARLVEQCSAARAAAEHARAVAARLQRFLALRTAAETHDRDRQAVQRDRAAIADAVRAEPVRALHEAARSAESAMTQAEAAAAALHVPGYEDAGHDAIVAAAASCAQRAAQLNHLLEVEMQFPAVQRAADDADLELAEARNAQEQCATRLRELPSLIASADRVAMAVRRRQVVRDQLAAVQRFDTTQTRLAAVRATQLEVVEAHQQAVDEHQRVVEARLSGMAAELAGQLSDGEPCAVCGASAHPGPARPLAKPVSAAQLRTAQRSRTEAEARRRAVDTELAETERELAVHAALAAADPELDLDRELGELDALLANGDVADADFVPERLRAELGELQQAHSTTASVAATALLAAQIAQAEVARFMVLLAEAAEGAPSVAVRHTQLSADASALSAMADAIRRRDEERRVHRNALERAQVEAIAAGFESLDIAIAAVLSPAHREELVQRVERWREHDQQLTAELAAAEFAGLTSSAGLAGLAGLAESAEPDLAQIAVALDGANARAQSSNHALAVAEQAQGDAEAALTRARHAVARFSDREADVESELAAQADLAAEVEPVVHLARLARGMAGHRRVALTTYVLRHWFGHVVDAANVRLRSISAGRYELVRVDEGETKNERAGLTLNVVDAHTGEARSPRSLSGGETFYTSLALALGLADVVKAEAGGADLDTLFIDEGFGSLDADTLAQVMDVIDDLRDGGRVVGVVSHVAELKERIPERLEVRRLPDGSSALRVVA